MLAVMSTRARTIAMLNDHLRRTFQGGRVVLTQSAAQNANRICAAVRAFDDFNESNDPYGEHDCAAFEIDGERYLFKIDYYDKSLEYGSEDPANATKTTRILTIMRADEY